MSEALSKDRDSGLRPMRLSNWSGEYEVVGHRAVVTLTERKPAGGEQTTTLHLTLDQIEALSELLSLAALDLRAAGARALAKRLGISTPWGR
jgi:hypothetical protein